ncbi:MAG: ABC transporter substrate-binding protein [Clostridia bacterium]|jgi:iron complex transport system substrate-binding protein|nr:ABC transporter substrate-binding protein [Clostridia bacterium]
MKPSKIVSLLLAIALLLVQLAAAASPVSVTDMKDRVIQLDAPAARIVALTASDCEILFALGAGETLVGRGAYCDYPPEILGIPVVQSGMETNIEQIVALEPQAVIMSTMSQTPEQAAALEAAGITVVASEANDIAGVYEAARLIGAVTGRTEEAETLIQSMQLSFAQIADRAAGQGSKTVYFEVSPLQWGLWTAGNGTFMNELAAMLGLLNVFDDLQGWGEISQEQVIERDPDYIVTIAMYFGEGPTPEEEILSREGWQDMRALKDGNILNIDSDAISRPGPRLADAAEILYQFVYKPKDSLSAE